MDDTVKSGLFSVFGSQASSPKLSSTFQGKWTMEQPIIFGQGASGNRSGERAAVSDREGPGGPVRRVRDRPRSPNTAALKQQQFASQQIGRGYTRSPDRQQIAPQQIGKGFTKSPDQQQFGQQQLGRGFTRSPDQQQYAQQQVGKGYVKSPDPQQFVQQQLGRGYAKSPDQLQFGQQQVGRGYAKSPEQQQSAQQIGKGNAKNPDQQRSASQPISKGYAKSPDQEREEEAAKARRLVRFRDEGKSSGVAARQGPKVGSVEKQAPKTSPTVGTGTALESGLKPLPVGTSHKRESTPVRRSDAVVEDSAEMDGPENLTAEAILGVCPDMCPEIEREERERKGDLDRFERVEGDRNQTSVDLAVKKYTRTAEKDAVLIRPLSVLKSTMVYLLSLLERDHEDDLLSVHNFLWDRMRAVRMDLRMQHIFGEDAITMHEQMIRFHILAMHELCEYIQGEAGVTEGFNAHLNIEQMNKTSVDLFQMYEDHRKKGISIPSEAEFRGYYALLKLDKHPGYRVEPAELSLDLAKMAPEIRRSPQVLFARDVARACRANNYVAFFRLARDATYLQACLIHAHFAKLRTQALASLHSGLLKNQGIPLSTVVDWLGMEGEDIEALIKYHGFSIKYYEEPYMVKEGAFLNKDRDFPTCRSQMVEAKRSSVIANDVQSGEPGSKLKKLESFGRVEVKERKPVMEGKAVPDVESSADGIIFDTTNTFGDTVEEDMPDYVEEEEQPPVVVEIIPSPAIYVMPEMTRSPTEEESKHSKKRRMEEPQFEAEEHEKRRLRHEADAAAGRAARQALAAEAKRQEEKLRGAAHKAEADLGKQWRWFRKWRRRTAAKALERQQKLERAEAALSTLSLGFPLSKMRVVGGDFVSLKDRQSYLDELMEERGMKLQEFWAPINIPRLVVPILQELNPSNKFVYWNILLSTGGSPAGNWIRNKISSKKVSGVGEEFSVEGDLDVTLADERKIFSDEAEGRSVGLWYSARELAAGRSRPDSASFHGVNGLIFVTKAEESVTVEHARWHTIVQALPDGVSVPLLVVSTKAGFNSGTGADQSSSERSWDLFLKTDEVSRCKIIKYKVIFIGISSEVNPGDKTYFSEEALEEGLHWLAKVCPVQPQLRPVLVADLVREHLHDHLRLLLKMPFTDVRPEHCITVYNKALEKAANEIRTTANVIPLNWPPDSRLPKKSESEESKVMAEDVWNLKETLESLYAVLQSCLLPAFDSVPNFDSGVDIFTQKSRLETVLLNYLSTLEGTSPDNPTTWWEVNRLVQRGCTVEWSKKGTNLVPRWARIFQSIFTTRLLLLNEMRATLVYVTRVDKRPPFEIEKFETCYRSAMQVIDNLDSSGNAELSLDDLIGLIAHGQERKTHSQHLEQGMRSPFREMQTPSIVATPRQVDHDYDFLQTPTSTPKTHMSPTEYGRESLEEVEREGTGHSSISEHVAEWLIFRTAFHTPKQLQLALTDSEVLLDDMMHELEIWKSSSTGDYPVVVDSGIHPLAPTNGNCVEIRKYYDQGSLEEDFDWEDSAGMHGNPHKKKKLNQKMVELELTESEILLGSLVAEFNSRTSEPNEVFTSKNGQYSGQVKDQVPRSGAALENIRENNNSFTPKVEVEVWRMQQASKQLMMHDRKDGPLTVEGNVERPSEKIMHIIGIDDHPELRLRYNEGFVLVLLLTADLVQPDRSKLAGGPCYCSNWHGQICEYVSERKWERRILKRDLVFSCGEGEGLWRCSEANNKLSDKTGGPHLLVSSIQRMLSLRQIHKDPLSHRHVRFYLR